ncbi:MAG: DUF3108 domain-containing protein [Bacteroidetes bacterium]|jgi:hypothetical protein|nr:DUF3108 domain-containing protein [Bacteroidota bacterium]
MKWWHAVMGAFLATMGATMAQNHLRDAVYAPEYRPFKAGEFLRYNIHYGLVNAGEASFRLADTLRNMANRPHYVVEVTGRSYRAWDVFFKVRDYYYSYIDTASMLPLVYSRNVQEGDFSYKESFLFDRVKMEARGKNPQGPQAIDIPARVQDLASMMYFARSVRFYNKPKGFVLPIDVFFESEWFASGAKLDGMAEVQTALGTFRCMRIIPQLVEGRVFKGQDDMVVYVSADKNQVPIRIESAIFVGSIKVDLVEYRNLRHRFTSQVR